MEVESESSSQNSHPIVRLGLCEVCGDLEAKYTCPRCEVKTCCLRCLNIHKKELDCDGVRDKTKFIPIRDMTKMDFLSDYTFLEECTRYVADRKRDHLKRHTRYNKTLPAHLFKLRGAAAERSTGLRFLLALFTRHAQNTTYYEWKTRVIRWRVEWVFPNAGNVRFVDERCDERLTVQQLLRKYVELKTPGIAEDEPTTAASDGGQPQLPQTDAIRKALEFYQARGVAPMRILLKAEGIKRSRTRFWELDVALSLRENLAGKTIVEFPVVYVVYDDVVKEFDVIDSDEDVGGETELYQLELKNTSAPLRRAAATNTNTADNGVVNIGDNMRELQLQRRREERRSKRTRQAKAPKNLLFTADVGDGNNNVSSDDDVDEESDGNETAEEEEASVEAPDRKHAKETFSPVVQDDEEYEQFSEAKRAKLAQ